MMIEEINDGPGSLSFENMFGYVADDLPPEQRRYLMDRKNIYTKGLYHVDEIGRGRNTFNWPYDYCSVVELASLETAVSYGTEGITGYDPPAPDYTTPTGELTTVLDGASDLSAQATVESALNWSDSE